jgi:hypothetical protein
MLYYRMKYWVMQAAGRVYGGGRAVTNSGILLFDTVSVHWATQHGDFNTVVVERVVPTVKDTTATAAATAAVSDDLAAVDTVEAVDENDQVVLADASDSDCDGTAAAAMTVSAAAAAAALSATVESSAADSALE